MITRFIYFITKLCGTRIVLYTCFFPFEVEAGSVEIRPGRCLFPLNNPPCLKEACSFRTAKCFIFHPPRLER